MLKWTSAEEHLTVSNVKRTLMCAEINIKVETDPVSAAVSLPAWEVLSLRHTGRFLHSFLKHETDSKHFWIRTQEFVNVANRYL